MSDPFHNQIRRSLSNSSLQSALDGNAERRLKARQQAYTSLPVEFETLRQRAHTVRAQVIANLDANLAEFSTQASTNGLILHQAADAKQAQQIVLDIARQNGARLIAKSKTMAGEEIELNQALEKAGLSVVETDLGEYIVQLRGERPAHIITPAVHLRRSDVAATFSAKFGIPYNEDIPAMTAIARGVLRQTFLEADIGLSGVNFGVAESGTLCLVTNEGNGRMVTTLPRIHIAVMGIERLLPKLEDLALMLALLARSATGQKLSVYTSLIHGPRRAGESDGPTQRHLILLDNGRRALLGSPLEEILYCIRCGACLNACPVFREIGGHAYVGAHGQATPYSGPLGSVISPGLFGVPEFGNLARASSLCGACKEACPVDINLPRLLLRVRAGMVAQNYIPAPQKGQNSARLARPAQVPRGLRLGLLVFKWAASSPRRYTTSLRLVGWLSHWLAPGSDWLRLPAFTGWGASRDFPKPAQVPFRLRFSQATKTIPAQINEALPTALPQPGRIERSVSRQPGARLKRFQDELAVLGAGLTACQPSELNSLLLAWLRQRQVKRLSAWAAERLPGDLLSSLQADGMEIGYEADPQAQAGITGALAGIADTGTLVLVGGVGQPLTTSLLPEYHIAILAEDQIFENMDCFLGSEPARQSLLNAPAAVFISGPSRTADIEMTLTIGVHGPREVQVFCLV